MRVLPKIVLLLILTALAVAKPESLVGARVHPEDRATAFGKFLLGAQRRTVVEIVGLPDQRIGADFWIYYQCRAIRDDPRTKGLDALVVLFKQDRVVAMRLTDSAALRKLIDQQALKVTGPSYADLLR